MGAGVGKRMIWGSSVVMKTLSSKNLLYKVISGGIEKFSTLKIRYGDSSIMYSYCNTKLNPELRK